MYWIYINLILAQLQQVFSLLDNWERYHPAESKVWAKKQFIIDYIAPVAQKSAYTDTKRAENIYRFACILRAIPELKSVILIFFLF